MIGGALVGALAGGGAGALAGGRRRRLLGTALGALGGAVAGMAAEAALTPTTMTTASGQTYTPFVGTAPGPIQNQHPGYFTSSGAPCGTGAILAGLCSQRSG